ncbi:MAG: DUF3592 domain-containing protein [Phycisphaerae bacterium]
MSRAKKKSISPKILFAIFLAMGLVMSYFLTYRPLSQLIDSRGWAETPCKITSAKVASHTSRNKGRTNTTYSIDIEYAYNFGGTAYHGERYDFIGGSSSGRGKKQAVVDKYRSAEAPICYINPEKPGQSVLNNQPHAGYLLTMIPLVFLFVGLFGLIFSDKIDDMQKRKHENRKPDNKQEINELGEICVGGKSKRGSFFAILVFALLWNGFAGVLVSNSISNMKHGGGAFAWGSMLFIIPFVLVGLLLLVIAISSFLQLFNPCITLILSSGEAKLGEGIVIKWKMNKGKVERIRKLKLTLQGVERVSYRSGKNRNTAKFKFFDMDFFSTDNKHEIMSGETVLLLPDNTMHSLDLGDKQIIWTVKLNGDIAKWPDVNEEYKIRVLPAGGEK